MVGAESQEKAPGGRAQALKEVEVGPFRVAVRVPRRRLVIDAGEVTKYYAEVSTEVAVYYRGEGGGAEQLVELRRFREAKRLTEVDMCESNLDDVYRDLARRVTDEAELHAEARVALLRYVTSRGVEVLVGGPEGRP